jgi:hypothetical protein
MLQIELTRAQLLDDGICVENNIRLWEWPINGI